MPVGGAPEAESLVRLLGPFEDERLMKFPMPCVMPVTTLPKLLFLAGDFSVC